MTQKQIQQEILTLKGKYSLSGTLEKNKEGIHNENVTTSGDPLV